MNSTYDSLFHREHVVILILERMPLHPQDETYLTLHRAYCKKLQNRGILLEYGQVLNDEAICISLKVSSDAEFDHIIRNDPSLDKVFTVAQIFPFQSMLKHKHEALLKD